MKARASARVGGFWESAAQQVENANTRRMRRGRTLQFSQVGDLRHELGHGLRHAGHAMHEPRSREYWLAAGVLRGGGRSRFRRSKKQSHHQPADKEGFRPCAFSKS